MPEGSSQSRPDPVIDGHRRLAALISYDILDTPAEQGFDDIVQLAAQICMVPVALLSLVAIDRQWFKAKVGFECCETPLDQSVCAHAIEAADILIIPDLRTDARTMSNPLVLGEPHLAFYAGVPLMTSEGIALGTLCVIDHAPRPAGLSDVQTNALRALARQVMSLLDLRRAVAARDHAIALQHAMIMPQETLIATQRNVSRAGGNLATILDTVVNGVIVAIPRTDGCVFEMIDGDELLYRSAVGALAKHAGIRIPIQGSLSGCCVTEETAILCPDAMLDPRINHAVAKRIDVRSCIVVPVLQDGAAIGVLLLQASTPHAFTDRDLQIAQLFAGTISAGLSAAGEADARRAVLASEARYQAIFDSAIDYAMVVIDLAGNIVDWNVGAKLIFGWSLEEIRGQSIEIFFTDTDVKESIPRREMQAALDHGRGVDERWHRRKDGSLFWANGEMMVLRDDGHQAVGFVKILRDRTEQRQAIADLLISESNLRTILATVPVGIMFAEAPSGRIIGRNMALDTIVGSPQSEPKTLDAYGEWVSYHVDGQRVQAQDYPLYRLLNEDIDEARLQVQYERRDKSRIWIEIVGRPIRDLEGRRTGAVIAVSDIDLRMRAEAMQTLMNNELSHRMKNLLAMVQAITVQSLRGATDIAKAREVLSNRFVALGKAHDLLLGGTVGRTQIDPVVRSGIGAHDDDGSSRFRCHGEPVEIGAKAALALTMMIHELTTNAAKYGALSKPDGYVDVAWRLLSVDDEQRLSIVWREYGGPAVSAPTSKGFGSRLIERSLSGIPGGTVSLDFASEGVVCCVEAPLLGLQAEE